MTTTKMPKYTAVGMFARLYDISPRKRKIESEHPLSGEKKNTTVLPYPPNPFQVRT